MSVIRGLYSRESSELVENALWATMAGLEKEVKTGGVSTDADVNELAMSYFENLKEKMEPYRKDYALWVALMVGGVEICFQPGSRIARDLEEYRKNSQTPFIPTWCKLCNPKRPRPVAPF